MSEHNTGSVGVGSLEVEAVGRSVNSKGGVFIVAMGVSGTGKSTLGSALSKRLGIPYVEGDDLHPKANVEKMSAGNPLNDADREPWLALIRETAERKIEEQREVNGLSGDLNGVVISCSSLKHYYRDILRGLRKDDAGAEGGSKKVDVGSLPPREPGSVVPSAFDTYFVFINGDRDTLLERMKRRPGHFMKAEMLDSQLETLEDPRDEKDVIPVSILDPTETQIADVLEGLKKLTVSPDLKQQFDKV